MADLGVETKAQPAIPEHWSVHLRCTVCFGYLREPHTLGCGHSFCRRCLKRLAEIARDDNPDVRVRRLTLTCPECRHPFPAKPVLTERISTCIVLKHLVELWKRECSLLASSPPLAMRSICTQTIKSTLAGSGEKEGQGGNTERSWSSGDLHEEFTVRMRPLDLYCEAVMQIASESAEDLENDLLQEALLSKGNDPGSGGILSGLGPAHNLAVAIIGPQHHHYHHHHHTGGGGGSDTSSDSEASSHSSTTRRLSAGRRGDAAGRNSDNEASSLSSVSIPDLFTRVTLFPHIGESAPARFLLLLVWCMYSVVIVGLAQNFLPYVIIFTLFFFLVVLR